jgi:hypothetical protein
MPASFFLISIFLYSFISLFDVCSCTHIAFVIETAGQVTDHDLVAAAPGRRVYELAFSDIYGSMLNSIKTAICVKENGIAFLQFGSADFCTVLSLIRRRPFKRNTKMLEYILDEA